MMATVAFNELIPTENLKLKIEIQHLRHWDIISHFIVSFSMTLLFTLKIWKCLTKFVILIALGEFSI